MARSISTGVLRGEIRPTNQMESFQKAYLSAVVAAAGCIVAEWNIDDGIDCQVRHKSKSHAREPDAQLEIQLKATHQVLPASKPERVGVRLDNDRFELFALPDPTIKKIVVVMIMPKDAADWLQASHDYLAVRHCMYWVNIAGQRATGQKETVVNAPTSQIFDDLALCDIMRRIGQGGKP